MSRNLLPWMLRYDWRRGLLHRRSETVGTHGAGDQIVAVEGHARQHDVAGGPTPRLVQPHRDVVFCEKQRLARTSKAEGDESEIGWAVANRIRIILRLKCIMFPKSF